MYVSASAGRRKSDHAAGAGSQVSADVGQSARKVDSSDRDAFGDARQDGMAVARVADRRLEHVAKRGRPELEQHAEPGVERTGHAGGEQPGAGDEVEPELSEALGRRGGGRRSLAADDEHVVARGGVENDRQVAAGPVQVRLDDLQHEPRRRGRVERVAAGLEQPHPGRRSEPVRRGDHPEGPVQLRPCGEHGPHFTRGD